MTREKVGIPIFPHADKEAASVALEKRDSADYQCYMALRDLLEEIGDFEGSVTMIDSFKEACLNGRLCVESRDQHNEDFMAAMAGRNK